jgi:hypothetical protein
MDPGFPGRLYNLQDAETANFGLKNPEDEA